jgi:hypothetical protein
MLKPSVPYDYWLLTENRLKALSCAFPEAEQRRIRLERDS